MNKEEQKDKAEETEQVEENVNETAKEKAEDNSASDDIVTKEELEDDDHAIILYQKFEKQLSSFGSLEAGLIISKCKELITAGNLTELSNQTAAIKRLYPMCETVDMLATLKQSVQTLNELLDALSDGDQIPTDLGKQNEPVIDTTAPVETDEEEVEEVEDKDEETDAETEQGADVANIDPSIMKVELTIPKNIAKDRIAGVVDVLAALKDFNQEAKDKLTETIWNIKENNIDNKLFMEFDEEFDIVEENLKALESARITYEIIK